MGWVVVGLVLAIAVLIYVGTRGGAPSPLQTPPPTWGPLTLSKVAVDAARAAGETHPTEGLWVSTTRMQAVPYLTGGTDRSAEADFLVAMRGRFHAVPSGATLPGSLPSGARLVVLVRGFDGRVTGLYVTNRALRHLRGLGIVHTLALGFHL